MYGHINKITYLDKMDFSTLGLVNALLLAALRTLSLLSHLENRDHNT